MKFLECLELTGKLPVYHLEKEAEIFKGICKNKPSAKLYTKKKIINALQDIEENHNHSWYMELRQRMKKDSKAIALFYRGNKINFDEMFTQADRVACAMAQAGITAGDEIPACLANTPELLYVMLAANKLGAKVNLFGKQLDKNYLKSILASCSDKLFLASDDNYAEIKDTVNSVGYQNKVIISLADSLPLHPEQTDEYVPELHQYYCMENYVPQFKEEDISILSFEEFISIGNYYIGEIRDNNTLDTEFLVTYTSGSTKIGFPKQIVHRNRSLITMGRFHDSELSGNPEIKHLRGMAHIHAESNTNLITCISDNLMQLWAVAMEPEYDKSKALEYVYLNKPNCLIATTSFLIEMAKQYLVEKKFAGKKIPSLFTVFAVGENTSKGEEHFINQFLKEVKAGSGVKIKGLSLPYTTLCIGGGDCEHGGIYYSLWHSLYEKLYAIPLRNKKYGMMPVPFAHVSVFKPVGENEYEECNYEECGIIAANSAVTMVGYKDNIEASANLIFTDTLGREWVSANTYGYIDRMGAVHVKGRIDKSYFAGNSDKVPDYVIEDMICRDAKNVLSCTVNHCVKNSVDMTIVNVDFQPFSKLSVEDNVKKVKEYCKKYFEEKNLQSLWIRVIDSKKSFPLNGSGKRSVRDLELLETQGAIPMK